jgi:hypothetical protein
MVTPRDGGEPFGFELKGPFSLSGPKLVARIAYTQIANGTSATATLVSDGRRAWIVSDRGTRALSSAQAQSVRGSLGGSGGLGGFDIGSWIRDPKVVDGPGGTDRVRGTLDVVAATNGLSGVAALAGRNVATIEDDDATRLRDATRSSSVDLLTSKGDRLLRRLALSADLGFDVPASLRRALGTRVGARIDFLLAVARPNSRVVVQAP